MAGDGDVDCLYLFFRHTSSLGCWMICWCFYVNQSIGNSEITTTDSVWLPLYIFLLLIIFMASICISFAAYAPELYLQHESATAELQGAWRHGFNRLLGFALVFFPFFFDMSGSTVDRHTVRFCFISYYLFVEGCVVLSFLRRYESCYGLLVSFLTLVVATSLKGFHPYDLLGYRVTICSLAVVIVFLSGITISPRCREGV